ncbi:hypothetical protein GCM10023116_16780 [Kistimonas scapharcae]|uniref:Uncharacterized protein n=1 Tax=Kistimonas scapharcae TaxID=1036133 RepID=A0ABP8V090_9GAMM
MQQADTPTDQQALEEERKVFCDFIDTSIQSDSGEQQDLESVLLIYLTGRLHAAEQDGKNIIFKIQLICMMAQELLTNKNIKQPQPLLNLLRLKYNVFLLELQGMSIDISDRIENSGIIPCQKVQELQMSFEHSMRYFIMDNPDSHDSIEFNENCSIPLSCIRHLKRNIMNNSYYLYDSRNPEYTHLLPSSHTIDERKNAIPVFFLQFSSLLNQNRDLTSLICQYITEDMGFSLTSILSSLLRVLLGPQIQLCESTISINTVITREQPVSLDSDDFVVTMKCLAHPVLDSIYTDAFGNHENLSQIREEWSQTQIWAEASLSFSSTTPDTVQFAPLEIHLTLPR